MSTKYKVIIERFAELHYLKKIKKKYKNSFDIPWQAFERMLSKFDLMLERSNTNKIVKVNENIVICKTEFKISPKESTKSSGNRCIVAQDIAEQKIRILLVYHKEDVKKGKETDWWKKMIRENYKEFKDCL